MLSIDKFNLKIWPKKMYIYELLNFNLLSIELINYPYT